MASNARLKLPESAVAEGSVLTAGVKPAGFGTVIVPERSVVTAVTVLVVVEGAPMVDVTSVVGWDVTVAVSVCVGNVEVEVTVSCSVMVVVLVVVAVDTAVALTFVVIVVVVE